MKISQVEILALIGGWHSGGMTTKLTRFFSIYFTKCFRKKIKIFVSVFEMNVKLFFVLKRKYFNLQTKVKVFPKQKQNVLKRKCFYLEKIWETKVFSKRKQSSFSF